MASPDVKCPICDGDLPLAGDEHPGDEVFCYFCGAPCVLKGKPDDDDLEAEADF
jgi:hypothetical protein